MFYSNKNIAFKIIGAYRLNGNVLTRSESGRSHTALSLRITGNTSIICGENNLKLTDGTVAYFPRGVDYFRQTREKEELLILHLEVYGNEEREIQTVMGCDDMQPIFETALREWEMGNYNRCMGALYEIFGVLERRAKKEKEIPISISAGVACLYKNFRDPELTVESLARTSHVSGAYFRRVYREHFGIAPMQALSELRFEYAKDLLRSGYYQIKQIALMSGFSDVKYFRTAFKTRFGITPNEYVSTL